MAAKTQKSIPPAATTLSADSQGRPLGVVWGDENEGGEEKDIEEQ